MKKALLLAVLGVVCLAAGALAKGPTIGVIGGADGPTNIFVTARYAVGPVLLLAVGGIALVTAVILFFKDKR